MKEAEEKIKLLARKVIAVKKAHAFGKVKEAEDALVMVVELLNLVVEKLKNPAQPGKGVDDGS